MLNDEDFLPPALYTYMIDEGVNEHPLLTELRQKTNELPEKQWQTPPEQGRFLGFMTRLTGAGNVLEIGTFTGYGTLAMALALPTGGRIVTLDVDDTFPSVGMPFWQRAGVEHQIELKKGFALETLSAMISSGVSDHFDMVFIDADKKEYDGYYEHALTLLRPGGLIMVDNMFWSGAVIDSADQRNSTKALRALMKKMKTDDRVDICVVPIADGVAMAIKK